jgi:patatin-like phospholipase/acyl hydrolase
MGLKRFRILSLDGGGIKGAFTAAVLAEWEKRRGSVIVDHFDLIAGTSTGGIIALGLGLGLPAGEILEFYEKAGAENFSEHNASTKIAPECSEI